ncbi:CpsD/CapB family tyrosine-protein kinase [Falsirhodobacter deserti]|uniref:CpsD/CapB family tyrosine-protein kinase n=1 Tax=Falsirhodobacter deserti TaxID=1365611 RepID=UPI000FE330EF|nr:CpsD/CapB family tyrosine-protein kinase [Falsirhodobacter deserti]
MEKLRAAMEKSRAMRSGTAPAIHMPRTTPRDVVGAASWADLRALPTDLAQLSLAASMGGTISAPFDLLRTRLRGIAQGQGWRRIAITSPTAGAGKSTLALNLAFSLMRQSDNRIVLMDMDMRRPGLARKLNLPLDGKAGTAEVLAGDASFAETAYRISDNLAITVNTHTRSGSAELLQSRRTAETLAQIEADYAPSIVIFDLPPMLACDDVAAFVPSIDCALLVVEAEVSTIAQVNRCEKELASLTNVAGVVLNKSRFEGSESYGEY